MKTSDKTLPHPTTRTSENQNVMPVGLHNFSESCLIKNTEIIVSQNVTAVLS